MWKDILKNIQIAGQRTSSKDYVLPDNEDEDCFKYFYDLVKLLDPSFELRRTLFDEDYWCKIYNQKWVIEEYDEEFYAFLGENSDREDNFEIVLILSEDRFADILFGEAGKDNEYTVKGEDYFIPETFNSENEPPDNLIYVSRRKLDSIILKVKNYVRGK